MDTFSKKKRSEIMSKIRSKNTLSERTVRSFLKSKKFSYKMHPKLFGKPDFIINKTAVFIDGCFWHGCPKHYKEPKTRRSYWIPKIKRNIARDREVTKDLKKEGYRVIRIWEHEVRDSSYKSKLQKSLNHAK